MTAFHDTAAAVRLQVMQATIETGQTPDASEVADALDLPRATVIDTFRQLHDGHIVVLEPGSNDRLRMANPFSAVPTRFRATVGERSWWGNCVWDGLGVIAMLGGDGVLASTCPDCNEPLAVSVAGREVQHGSGVAYIGVPAVSWWDNIIDT